MALNPEQVRFLTSYVGKVREAADKEQSVAIAPNTKVMPIWQTAKEKTDASISALQTALKSHRHAALRQIADAGLNGITEGNQTAMMRALIEYDAAPDDNKDAAGKRLLAQAKAYSAFLNSSAIIPLAENNPFGVPVEIRKPLDAALTQIMRIAA